MEVSYGEYFESWSSHTEDILDENVKYFVIQDLMIIMMQILADEWMDINDTEFEF